jgi:hypothetical protein
LGHENDNFCLLWKDQSGKHKYIKSQNQDTTLLKICKNFSGLEGVRACNPEVAIKGEISYDLLGLHLQIYIFAASRILLMMI